MKHFVGFDPALNSPGLAGGDEHGFLRWCEAVKIPDAVRELDIGERIQEVGRRCYEAFRAHGYATPYRHHLVVCYEHPQIYGGPRAEDPNDLLAIGMVAAAFVAQLGAAGFITTVLSPTPRKWSGGLGKVTRGDLWASPRAEHLARRLTPEERALVPRQHDAMDAASLVLYASGRWAAKRVNARPRRAAGE